GRNGTCSGTSSMRAMGGTAVTGRMVTADPADRFRARGQRSPLPSGFASRDLRSVGVQGSFRGAGDAARGTAPPAPSLTEAYAHCARVVRASGSSFAAAFWMLPTERRRALHAVYAFCRLADDIADDPTVRGDRRALLERWRG